MTAGGTNELTRKHRPDYRIILYMGLLVLIGLVILFAISPARVELLNQGGGGISQSYFVEKQVLYLAGGLTVFAVAAGIPLGFWQTHAHRILWLGIGACLLLALLGMFMDGGIVLEAGGATRWYNFGVVSFQPAELLKFGVLLFAAFFLAKRIAAGTLNRLNDTLVPIAIIIGVAALFIIVLQKDLGTGLTMLAMVAAMLYVSGMSRRLLALGAVVLAVLGFLAVVTSPHRIERILTFVSPSGVAQESSYHITQAKIALGSGGIFGKGLGQSVQAFGYLPEAINDSVFAIVGESFGFIGAVIVLAIYLFLLLRILRIAEALPDMRMRLLAAGIFGWIGAHVIVNVGAITGVTPLTGVTLPFLSFGGTSLIFTMLILGILLQLSRFTTHQDIMEPSDESVMRRRGLGGSRYPGRRGYQRTG